MELQRVVRTQTHIQPYLEKVRKRVPLVRQEQRVVAQRAHGQPDLFQVEKVLQGGDFTQEDAV